jgi:DNA-binding HxlR family transcriptional regulator
MTDTKAATVSELMRRGELFSVKCPSREILKHVTSRWGVLVLVALLEGTHRFSDLRRKAGGVSEKMLAQTLQCLEKDGFVNRVSFPVVPPHVEYTLTPMGEEVAHKVELLADWIEENTSRIMKVQQEVKG